MINCSKILKEVAHMKKNIDNKLIFLNVWHRFNIMFLDLKILVPGIWMGLGIYFIHSAALPSIYLSPCVYMSPALIWINAVSQSLLYCMIHCYWKKQLKATK